MASSSYSADYSLDLEELCRFQSIAKRPRVLSLISAEIASLNNKGVDQEKVEAEFKPMSVDVKFHDVQGKNHRCAVPKLHQEIVPEKSKITVKPNKVVITLQKASKGNWLDLHFKEDKLKPKFEENPDPMAGIMDLMKNMYEEGDDEMKRTIAKAWTDARSGRTSDSLTGFR